MKKLLICKIMELFDKETLDILRWDRIGTIVCRIAQKLGIRPIDALRDFYKSQTCELFHKKSSGLYLYGDYYIADEYLLEKGYDLQQLQ